MSIVNKKEEYYVEETRAEVVNLNPRLEAANISDKNLSSYEYLNSFIKKRAELYGGYKSFGEWLKSTYANDRRRFSEFEHLLKNKSILDFNATNGGFLRLASSVANKTAAVKYTPYLDYDFEQMGIDIFRSIDSIDEQFDVITLFNIIENIPSAEDILQKLASKLKRGGLILIETQNEQDALLEYYESKSFEAFINMNCRSKLFNIKSLNTMLRKAHLKPLSIRQIQKFPFSNHLHWLLTNRPDGHKKWGLIDKIFPSYFYQSILKKYNTCDTLISVVSV